MSEASSGSCRVVELEWDRGHETLKGIVRAHTSIGLVITEVSDLCAQPGLCWIRADEIVSINDLDDHDWEVRLADLRKTRNAHVDESLTTLSTLIQHLAKRDGLIGVYRARTGSDEFFVGEIVALDADGLHLRDFDTEGWCRCDPPDLDFSLAEIIRLDWGTDYLTALTELAAAQPTEPAWTDEPPHPSVHH